MTNPQYPNGYTEPSNQNPQAPITAPNYMGPGPVLTPETPQTNWLGLPGTPQQNTAQINFAGGTTGPSTGLGPSINWQGTPVNNGVTGNYGASQVNWNGGPNYTNPNDHNQKVQASIDAFSNQGGAYLSNAARRGMEAANSRGVMNSNIAGGLASRYAMEAMDPYIAQATDLNKTREGFQFQSGESAKDRSLQVAVENGRMSNDMAKLLASHVFDGNQAAYDRTLQVALAQGQIDSQTYQMLKGQEFQGRESSLDRSLSTSLAQGQIAAQAALQQNQLAFSGQQSSYDRELQAGLQQGKIDADTGNQLRQIGFQSMQNSLDRTQQSALQNQQYAFQGEQNTLDRANRDKLQSDATFQQDWLSSRSFEREFESNLSMIPLSAAADLTSYISKYAVENPEVYTPEIVNGMSNFMSQNMASVLGQYFPNRQSSVSYNQSGGSTGPLPPAGGATDRPFLALGGNN